MPNSINWKLCNTEFLDLNITWYTEQPQFSPCFRDTLLIWLPACMIIFAAICESLSIRRKAVESHRKTIPWNPFNQSRLTLTILLVILRLLDFTNHIYYVSLANSDGSGRVIVLSSLLAPFIQLTAYCILGIIYYYQRKAGIHTSGPVWFYLSATVICSSIDFYAVILSIRYNPISDIERYIDYIHMPALLVLFFLECRGDTPVLSDDDSGNGNGNGNGDIRPTSPEVTASYCSSITFWWYNRFLLFGYRCKLRMVDLWKTLPRDKACELVPIFRRTWVQRGGSSAKLAAAAAANKETATYYLASGEVQPVNSMLKVLAKLFWAPLLFAASLKFIQDSLQYLTPMILKRILAFMKAPTEGPGAVPNWHGVLWALLLLVTPTLQSVILGNYFYQMQLIGNHVKTMIVGSVFRKALLLSGSSRLQSTSGEIVNLIAVDSQRFQDLLVYVNLIWSAPFQIILAIYLLYRELGWSVFAGVACMTLVLPANAYVANRIKYSQIKVMRTKDERIKQVNEVLGGIKVIKLYAWENSFISNLYNFRNRELAFLRRILTLDAFQVFLWNCCPFVVACVTFAVYINADPANVLDAEKAFVSISLFNLLRFPLTMLPSLVTSIVLTVVSARRLNRFLNSNELIKYITRNDELEAISIEGGTLSWSGEGGRGGGGSSSSAKPDVDQHKAAAADKSNGSANKQSQQAQQQQQQQQDSKQPILRDIELHVKPKSFVAIVGQVASGKSSLLSAILGEMHRIAGRFNICKSMSIAYVPQQAWIQNMTVKDNILFGSEYDEERYKRVLAACSLQSDLDTLPGGDQAEIGEKGINLSGGQKQRVSLARACYSEADIHLLDDPLSALDSHVAKHVYEHVLSSSTGLLRDKTRVLATNSLFVLPHVDHIVVLEGGRVVESGSYKDLMSNASGHLAEFMRQYSVTQQRDRADATSVSSLSASNGGNANTTTTTTTDSAATTVTADDKLKLKAEEEAADRAGLTSLVQAPPKGGRNGDDDDDEEDGIGKLIDAEKVEVGSVNYRVYLKYFASVSWLWMLLVALSLFASTTFNIATNLWLSMWASDAEDPEKSTDTDLRTIRLLVYAIFGGLQCLFVLAASLALCRGAVRAARILHLSLLERVMHSPMTFFDTTPIGRVVNRFAKDIDVIDSTLPGTFRSWFTCLLQVLSTLFVICFSFPTFLVILVPLACLYFLIQRVFIVTTRQLKRLESNTRSPIYSNFNETLTGLSSIRAYDCVDRFVTYSDNLVDRNQSCSYPNIIANRWLSVRLELFGNLITSMAALFSVYYKGSIGAGVAGLTISYSLSITQTLSWLVRMTSDLETHIVSVERILEYMQNNQEDKWIKEDSRPPRDWPTSGAIDIQHYSTRYREDTDLVLREISLSIRPREKIGIVGRTGSGKSSLSLALFRILEPASGGISIDGYSLSKFGLHDIRSKLTIIPQDPVLFSGTLRFNLDPLKLYSDLDIWRSLELAHLKPYISTLESGLDYRVSEYGENFSVGQRQLICLARAILRKSKILILDEATASVDLETDSIVQKTIRDIFSDCTIITIAHRLHTILDSDRILVLDSGKVKELDSPAKLIGDSHSAFASLVRDAGVDTSSILSQKQSNRQPLGKDSNNDDDDDARPTTIKSDKI